MPGGRSQCGNYASARSLLDFTDIVQRVQLKVIEVVIQGCDALGESVES